MKTSLTKQNSFLNKHDNYTLIPATKDTVSTIASKPIDSIKKQSYILNEFQNDHTLTPATKNASSIIASKPIRSSLTKQNSILDDIQNSHFQKLVYLVDEEAVQKSNEQFTCDQQLQEKKDKKMPLHVVSERPMRLNESAKKLMKPRSASCKDVIQMNASISRDIVKLGHHSSVQATIVEEKNALSTFSRCDYSSKPFENFLFLSADRLTMAPENISCWGKTNLSPITLRSSGIMDQYPSKKACAFDSLSTFCFPHGLSIRIIPNCAIDGAKRLGWIGRKAHRYHLHAVSLLNCFKT